MGGSQRAASASIPSLRARSINSCAFRFFTRRARMNAGIEQRQPLHSFRRHPQNLERHAAAHRMPGNRETLRRSIEHQPRHRR